MRQPRSARECNHEPHIEPNMTDTKPVSEVVDAEKILKYEPDHTERQGGINYAWVPTSFIKQAKRVARAALEGKDNG